MGKRVISIVWLLCFCTFNNCQCPPERYFDYKTLKVEAQKETIPQGERLMLRISPDEVYYLAEQSANVFSPVGCAYATSVCEKGYDGEKYSITSVHVYSDSDFDDTHLVGEELTDLIKAYGRDSMGNYIFDYLENFSFADVNPWYLYMEDRPTLSQSHILTIQFEKSNGEVASGMSGRIVWE